MLSEPSTMKACEACGRVRKVYASVIRRGRGRWCSLQCRPVRTGAESPNWKGGRHKTGSGHIIVKAPHDPHARSEGYALEHRRVAAEVLGRPLMRHEVVHHINGRPDDNSPSNLQVMHQGDHMRLHRPGRSKLSEADVRAIRVAHAGGMTQATLRKEYCMSAYAIWAIVHRKNWAHIEP